MRSTELSGGFAHWSRPSISVCVLSLHLVYMPLKTDTGRRKHYPEPFVFSFSFILGATFWTGICPLRDLFPLQACISFSFALSPWENNGHSSHGEAIPAGSRRQQGLVGTHWCAPEVLRSQGMHSLDCYGNWLKQRVNTQTIAKDNFHFQPRVNVTRFWVLLRAVPASAKPEEYKSLITAKSDHGT